MSDVTLEQVIQMVDQLSAVEREILKKHLELTEATETGRKSITLENIKAETEHLRASGAFEHAEDLTDRWAKPDFDLTDEELRAGIKEFANQWEEDIAELGDD